MENLSLGFCDRLFFVFFFHFQFLLTLFQGWPEAPLSSPSHCRGWEEGGNQTEWSQGCRSAWEWSQTPCAQNELGSVPYSTCGELLALPSQRVQGLQCGPKCMSAGDMLSLREKPLRDRVVSPACQVPVPALQRSGEWRTSTGTQKPSVSSLAEAPVKVLYRLVDGPINVES